jgi:HEAT repeat protein
MNQHLCRIRWVNHAFLALAVFACGSFARADDPVEDLRRVLSTGSSTAEKSSPEALDFRRKKIQEAADKMDTIGQLGRALTLDEWKVESDPILNDPLRAVDIEMRRMIGLKLKKSLEAAAASDVPTARLAVANTIAEMGPTVRALDPDNRHGFSRSLEPVVAKLCEDPSLGVRQEALRALGNINGDPKFVTDVFRKTLKNDPKIGPRRLAADGLQQLIRVVNHFTKPGRANTAVTANRRDLLDVLEVIPPIAAIGVQDADSEVRMLSFNALQLAAQSLAELLEVPVGFARKNFPQPGRKLTVEERANILEAYRAAEQDLKFAKPMIEAFKKEMPTYAVGLRDLEPHVRLAATRAFENLGNARLRLVRRANNLPTLLDEKGEVERSPAELLKEADFMQPVLDRDMPQVILLLRDPDVRIRRSTAEALEVLEAKAEPAMAGLIQALKDPDRFVRWTSAKTLGFMPPDKAAAAIVPLAATLADSDINVQIAAAASLEALAGVGKEAIPALAEAIQKGDIEARQAALYALKAMPKDAINEAVPALIKCLRLADDPRAIGLACLILEQIGPPAAPALEHLQQLIGHSDADVRKNASAAILSIVRVAPQR